MIIKFISPNGLSIDSPDIDEMKANMIDNFPNYWQQGNEATSMDCIINGKVINSLLALSSAKHGIYLKYLAMNGRKILDECLSLEDSSKMDTHVECSDEWYASEGLFLPPEKAWIAINEFLNNGSKSKEVSWINSKDMPENSNW